MVDSLSNDNSTIDVVLISKVVYLPGFNWKDGFSLIMIIKYFLECTFESLFLVSIIFLAL